MPTSAVPKSVDRAIVNIRAKVNSKAPVDKLRKLAKKSSSRAKTVMGQSAAYWHSLVIPKIPVRAAIMGSFSKTGRGQLKQRTQPFVKQSQSVIRAGLTFMVGYAIWLIAGTAKIAGGAVMRWKEGQRPITSWPAKSQGGNPRGEMPVALPYRKATLQFLKERIGKELVK